MSAISLPTSSPPGASIPPGIKVAIASPCRVKWSSMKQVGDDARVRECGDCKMKVFTVSELTREEFFTLLRERDATGGRVCGRVFLRADGTVVTKDCPVGLRKKVLGGLVTGLALFLAVVGVGVMRARRNECPTTGSWFDRVVTAKVVAAREELRDTKMLGALVNQLFPLPPVKMIKGDMAYVPPSAPSGGALGNP
ncbi:MAG: hypothetical protein U0228_08605 [Myxococcaceae bacterium]